MLRPTLSLLLLLSLAACGTTAGLHSSELVLPPGEVVGETLEPRPVARFATVNADPSSFFERTVLVEASVVAVCQKAGCWMQIEDQREGDAEPAVAMVRWESGCGGKYAFPTDLEGRRVLVQGSFYPKEISEADAEHLEEEAGRELEIDRDGYEFNASAVLLMDE